ncbi:putative tick transposon [Operophtera brumata]|uniref:Putative tick transposon n=1 Tax=Operophtera brumata TaxID=104452 RepID=A0A0L7LEA9_OPEBR|nr:putative tick transposon [Operophtera brumata]
MPYGKIDCFDLSSRKWTKYVSRVKQFIALNEIKDSLHVATLITVVGEPTYDLMCDLCAPNKPETKTFTELAGEELSLYLQTLKHLASTCNFAEKLEENLRDQFVSGLAGDEMRSRLFAEKDLDYKRAVELALALEAAETRGSAGAQGAASALVGAPEPPVHRIGGGGGTSAAHQARGSNQKCWRCGRQHPPDNCRYRRYNCDECGVRGHLKAMCKSARSSGDSAGDRSVGKSQRRNQFYIEMDSESEDSDFFNIVVDGEDDKLYVVPILVNNIPIDFEVDTGSKISAINERDYQIYFRNCQLSQCNLRFKGYTGGKILPIGFLNTTVCYSGAGEKREARDLPLYVIREGGPPLLGRSWLRHLKLKNIEIQMNNIGCDMSCSKTDSKWVEGQVKEQVGPSSFSINVPSANNTVKRHIDQMIIPKVNRKRFSLSCTTNDNSVVKSNVNSDMCKELPVVTHSEPVVAVSAASTAAASDAADDKSEGEQGNAFEMASSSPVVSKDAHYLRPRHNRHPSYN